MSVSIDRFVRFAVAALCIALIFGGRSAASSSLLKDPFLGIAPQDEHYYKSSSDIIQCKDGSKKFTRDQLNDNFCDCPDGTDEPGTSACPSGKFYCQNLGHAQIVLHSSRVNDNICDCCDGSDEYDGNVKCKNTCWEAGKVARDKLKKKIAMYKEGAALRKQELEKSKLAVAKDEAELLTLKNEEKILKGLVEQLKEHKDQIDKVEENERLQKEKEEKEKEEAGEAARQEKGDTDEEHTKSLHGDEHEHVEDSSPNQVKAEDYDDSAAKVEQSDTSENEGSRLNDVVEHPEEDDGESFLPERNEVTTSTSEIGHDDEDKVSPDQVTNVGNDASENKDALSREELGRLVASRWTGANSGKEAKEVDSVNDNDNEGHEEMPKDSHDEYEGYASGTDDENPTYDEDEDDLVEEDLENEVHDLSTPYEYESGDEDSDKKTSSNLSWLEKIQQAVRKILRSVNFFQTPLDKSEYAYVRKEYDESSAKLSKIQSRISSLSQKLKHDFGLDKEFYLFHDNCFESKQNKYVYKVCPFKQASQVEGHSTTRLGRWDKFEDSYRTMIFSNGDKCWNGPDRSLKVKLRCGLKNEVADVDEPSRCEYVALLSTPLLCLDEKLEELQNKLHLMENQQPHSHDEL